MRTERAGRPASAPIDPHAHARPPPTRPHGARHAPARALAISAHAQGLPRLAQRTLEPGPACATRRASPSRFGVLLQRGRSNPHFARRAEPANCTWETGLANWSGSPADYSGLVPVRPVLLEGPWGPWDRRQRARTAPARFPREPSTPSRAHAHARPPTRFCDFIAQPTDDGLQTLTHTTTRAYAPPAATTPAVPRPYDRFPPPRTRPSAIYADTIYTDTNGKSLHLRPRAVGCQPLRCSRIDGHCFRLLGPAVPRPHIRFPSPRARPNATFADCCAQDTRLKNFHFGCARIYPPSCLHPLTFLISTREVRVLPKNTRVFSRYFNLLPPGRSPEISS